MITMTFSLAHPHGRDAIAEPRADENARIRSALPRGGGGCLVPGRGVHPIDRGPQCLDRCIGCCCFGPIALQPLDV